MKSAGSVGMMKSAGRFTASGLGCAAWLPTMVGSFSMRAVLLALSAMLLVVDALPVRAQTTAEALISPQSARRVGLERMWFTQLNMDRARGRVEGLHLHVSQ